MSHCPSFLVCQQFWPGLTSGLCPSLSQTRYFHDLHVLEHDSNGFIPFVIMSVGIQTYGNDTLGKGILLKYRPTQQVRNERSFKIFLGGSNNMLEPVFAIINGIVSLAELAWRTCADATTYKQDCIRIGDRLQVLIVLSKQWGGTATAPSISSLKNLQNVLYTLNVTLQKATTEQSTWTKRVRIFVFSTNVLDELLSAERNLNSALQDFQTAQNYQLLQVVSQNSDLHQRFQRVEAALIHLAQRRITPDDKDSPSFIQVMNEVLDYHHLDPTKSGDTGTTQTTTETDDIIDDDDEEEEEYSYLDSLSIHNIGIEVEESLALERSDVRYSSKNCLGSGSFGDVFSGIYKGEKIAVKLIRIPPSVDAIRYKSIIERLKREASVMARMSIHPNILHLHGFDLEGSPPMLALELMDITLYAALRSPERYENLKPLNLMKGIASAIEFLHLQGIVHRDIKSLNILLSKDSTVAKLSDFGEAKAKGLQSTTMHGSTLVGSAARSHGGTVAYHSPEILLGRLAGASRKADMYAYGVVLWECSTRRIPFEKKREYDIIRLAIDETRRFLLDIPEIHSMRSEEAKRLLTVAKMCLARFPKDRPNATQAVRKIHHETWNDIGTLANSEQRKDKPAKITAQSNNTQRTSSKDAMKAQMYTSPSDLRNRLLGSAKDAPNTTQPVHPVDDEEAQQPKLSTDTVANNDDDENAISARRPDKRLHNVWKCRKALGIIIVFAEVLTLGFLGLNRNGGFGYLLSFAAEVIALGLFLLFQKYRRVGVTPLSLLWQPDNLIDLITIPILQLVMGITTLSLTNWDWTGIYYFLVPSLFLNCTMASVALFAIAWSILRWRQLLNNDVAALVAASRVAQLLATTWLLRKLSINILVLFVLGAINSRLGALLLPLLELCRIGLEVHAVQRDTKLTYICGKLLIPIKSLGIFEYLNTAEQAQVLKSNRRLDGVVAITSSKVSSAQTVFDIQNLIPILDSEGPLAGGEWCSHLGGGNPHNAHFTVKLAITTMQDSKSIVWNEQDDRLYMITSPNGSSSGSGLVIEKDGSSQFSDNIVFPQGNSTWRGNRIVN